MPELRLFDPISNVLEEEGVNKSDSLKVIKTSPFLFPVEMEELPRENKEPIHILFKPTYYFEIDIYTYYLAIYILCKSTSSFVLSFC